MMRGLLVVAALAACATSLAASSSEHLVSPLLLWSNRDVVGQGSGGAQVMYKVLENVEEATTSAILALLGKGEGASELVDTGRKDAPSARTTVIVFAGTHLGAGDLRSGAAAKLGEVLGSAASSLVVPYAIGRAGAGSLTTSLEAAGVTVRAVGCGQQRSDDLIGELVEAASSAASDVVVLCPGGEGGLAGELEALMAVQEAIDASGLPHVLVYTTAKAEARQARRGLAEEGSVLTGFGAYAECGTLCQTQVRWLEGMLSISFLAIAIGLGLTCLNAMNTPTRFEVLKEGQTM